MKSWGLALVILQVALSVVLLIGAALLLRSFVHVQRADIGFDAGPVLFGYGTAATGIGLGPARLYGDEAQYAGIERLADTVVRMG